MRMASPSQWDAQSGRDELTDINHITASNGASWAFGGGIPMGCAGLPNPRPSNPATSFAQTIGGPQPATPLDLS
jgi:hypothetical protein